MNKPTTDLRFADVEKLIGVLNRLVTAGNSVLVIEHNLDVIQTCDWVLDMGPEGGDGGGRLIAQGTPEQVAQVKGSYTSDISLRGSTPNVLVGFVTWPCVRRREFGFVGLYLLQAREKPLQGG